ncbi:MAG: T9SS type A sorting domain-containing protein [Bacteroidetes bacterium]|nr:T9SS type A sorting domain-containing protein [Bacteroidota bacterium]
MKNGKVRFNRYLVLLLILHAFFSQVEAKASICCVGGNGEKCWNSSKKKKNVQIKRTFSPPGRSVNLISAAGPSNGFNPVNPPVITYADLNYAYSPQNDLYYYAQSYGTGSMNIGPVNKLTAQQWTMPNCTFEDIDSAVGIPVSQTPYLQYFPTATHCKLYEYLEYGEIYSYFEYYDLNPSGITLLGSVDDFDFTPNADTTDLFIAPLEIDINFHLVVNDTLINGNQKKILNEVIDAEGFGTLTTQWGNFDVIKIVNHYNEFYYENGILIDEFHQPVVTFISKDGNQLDVTLPEGSATTGTVATEMIEFTRIVYDSFATLQNETLGSGTTNCYDAFGTITVAGNGTAFTANSGSSATMISGRNIKYQAGTKVKSGGLMHGYITANSQYCPINYNYINPASGNQISGNANAISPTDGGKNGKLRIFPNPTTGDVTLQLPENEETQMIKVEITDINGLNGISKDIPGLGQYTISVESLPPGIYFLHVTTGKSRETVKLIRL